VSPVRYLSQAAIGRALGVSRYAIVKMRARHEDFPQPDAWVLNDMNEASTVNSAPLWLPERLPEIIAWRKSLPGRGAGGGRPPRAAPE
jgi:hypothetical protein